MPTYEYRCRDCGQHLEVVQSFRDDPLTECPNCSGTLKKVFQPIGIAFKGSGFYKTDSRSSGSSKAASGSSDKASTSAESSSSDSSGSSDSSSGSGSSGSESSSSGSSDSSSGSGSKPSGSGGSKTSAA